MKVFISQPMRGKTDDEIKEERAAAEGLVRGKLRGDVEVIDSFIDARQKRSTKPYIIWEEASNCWRMRI